MPAHFYLLIFGFFALSGFAKVTEIDLNYWDHHQNCYFSYLAYISSSKNRKVKTNFSMAEIHGFDYRHLPRQYCMTGIYSSTHVWLHF